MDERMVQFIAGLRAAGVRVSLAESEDAFHAVATLGVLDRETFRTALRAMLVKEHTDQPIFDKLFPLYFNTGAPPFLPPGEMLTPEQQRLLAAAMQALAGNLQQLLRMLATGQGPTREQLQAWARAAGANRARQPEHQRYLTREMLRQMGLEQLAEQIEQLMQQLAQLGLTAEGQQQVRALLQANLQALQAQAAQMVGENIAQQLTDRPPRKLDESALLNRPFNDLSQAEAHELQQLVARLGARLRTRAALRQKKGDGKTLDVKTTLRSNLRTGGVPFHLHFKKRHLKPKFALLCDMSESMRPFIEFMLRLVYELQGHVTKARSFGFYDRLEEISDDFWGHHPNEAIPLIQYRFPHRPYATDLGLCLAQLCEHYLDALDHRTTLIILGDGRNNMKHPHLELLDQLKRRVRRIVWFNPEPRTQWGSGDSDMLQYAPLCDAVHQVSNLAELSEAVDKLFGAR